MMHLLSDEVRRNPYPAMGWSVKEIVLFSLFFSFFCQWDQS